MNDYIVQIVKREKINGEIITKALMIALCAITFLLFLVLVGSSMGALMIIVFALVVVGTVLVFRSYKLEYEYELIGSELRISKIIASTSRRSNNVFDLDRLDSIKPFSANQSYSDIKYKKFDFTSGVDNGNTYEARVYYKNELVLLYFEPNEKLLAAIKYLNPNKVSI